MKLAIMSTNKKKNIVILSNKNIDKNYFVLVIL